MPKAQANSILNRMRADYEEALEQDTARRDDRRGAALAATARAVRWSGFARDPDYRETLIWRATTLSRAKGATESAGDGPAEALATTKRFTAPTESDAARVFGRVESDTGGGEARLVDAEGCVIATSPIDKLGFYAIVAEATGEAAQIEIRDAQGQLAVLDGHILKLTPGLTVERNFKTGRCGRTEPAPEDQPIEMPDLTGKTDKEARAVLDALGDFRISFKEHHSDEAADTVVDQTPTAGRTLSPGDTIVLDVSLGPEPEQEMPKLVGMSEPEARKVLSELTFRAVRFVQVVDARRVGRVVRQTPEPGEPVVETTEITLCIGVAALLMPNLVGKTRKAALEILVPDYVGAPKIEEVPHDGPEDIVLKQSPAAGGKIGKEGVLLHVSARGAPEPAKDEGGSTKRIVPNVLGLTRAQALKALAAAGIDDAAFDAKEARRKGARVVAQGPSADTALDDGQAVSLEFGKPK